MLDYNLKNRHGLGWVGLQLQEAEDWKIVTRQAWDINEVKCCNCWYIILNYSIFRPIGLIVCKLLIGQPGTRTYKCKILP